MKKLYFGVPLMVAALAACSSDSVLPTSTGMSATGLRPKYSISGAFNTNVWNGGVCGTVNGNLYPNKADVALNGNPSDLDGTLYYVKVESPNGILLGISDGATFDALGGNCAQLITLVHIPGTTTAGFSTTPNAGGEYKVTISHSGDFSNGDTKSDNFKIRDDETTITVAATVTVNKFYDANTDGIQNNGEVNIAGWKVNVAPFIGSAYDVITPFSGSLDNGFYTFAEYSTIETNWMHTTAASFNRTIGTDSPDVLFGNVCVGAGGGLTLGFWSNKNGQLLFGDGDRGMLNDLYLRNATGADQTFTNYAAFRTWDLNATATNMAYMLSAQLGAMELNVYNGFVSGSTLIYAPGATSGNALGFASVSAVMAEANLSLQTNGVTVAAGTVRTYQEALKNALDAANNNKNFVQSSPCPFTFPTL